jgi:hypothetical protein
MMPSWGRARSGLHRTVEKSCEVLRHQHHTLYLIVFNEISVWRALPQMRRRRNS